MVFTPARRPFHFTASGVHILAFSAPRGHQGMCPCVKRNPAGVIWRGHRLRQPRLRAPGPLLWLREREVQRVTAPGTRAVAVLNLQPRLPQPGPCWLNQSRRGRLSNPRPTEHAHSPSKPRAGQGGTAAVRGVLLRGRPLQLPRGPAREQRRRPRAGKGGRGDRGAAPSRPFPVPKARPQQPTGPGLRAGGTN